MKPFKIIAICGALVGLSGCGSEEAESVAVPPPAAPPAVSPAPATPIAPAPAPDAPPPTAAGAAIMPSPQDTEVKVTDVEGKPIPLLDFMNAAVQNYDRTRASMTEGNPWPPLTSLEVMVQVGYMKRLPAAPAGQKFHLDPTTMKVTLVPQ